MNNIYSWLAQEKFKYFDKKIIIILIKLLLNQYREKIQV